MAGAQAIGGAYVDFGGRTAGFDAALSHVQRGMLGLRSFGQGVAGAMASIGAVAGRLLGPAAALLGAASVSAGVSQSVKLAADFESLSVVFEVLTGNAEKARATLADLAQFAASTPFSFDQITQAGRLLLTQVDASQLREELTIIGNIAAGVGANLMDLIVPFTQVRTKGVLLTQDMRQFGDRGVPVLAALAKHFGVTEAAVVRMVESSQVSFADFREALRKLQAEGGLFEDMMGRQGGTTNQLWSNLGDSLAQLKTRFGEVLIETFRVKDALRAMIAAIDTVRVALFGTAQGAEQTMAALHQRAMWLATSVAVLGQRAGSALALAVITVASEVSGLVDRTLDRLFAAVTGWVVRVGVAVSSGVAAQVQAIVALVTDAASGVASVLSNALSGNVQATLAAVAGLGAATAGNAAELGRAAFDAALGNALAIGSGVGAAKGLAGAVAADAAQTIGRVTGAIGSGLGGAGGFLAGGFSGMFGGAAAALAAAGEAGGPGEAAGARGRPEFVALSDRFDEIQKRLLGSGGDAAERTAKAAEQTAGGIEGVKKASERSAMGIEKAVALLAGGVPAVFA